MKNLFKFLLFVALLSAAISLLYDYRLRHGGLSFVGHSTPEKYTLASAPSVDPKDVGSLDALNRERRTLVSSVLPSVVSVKTSKKVATRRQYGLDPFEYFNRNPRQFRNPNDEATIQRARAGCSGDDGHADSTDVNNDGLWRPRCFHDRRNAFGPRQDHHRRSRHCQAR